jgi:cobalt/nickel transport system permease protein
MSLEPASDSWDDTGVSAASPRFPASCDARLKLCVALVGWLLILSADRALAALVIGAAAWLSLLALGAPRKPGLRALRAALFTGGMAVVLRLLLTGGEPALAWRVLGHELTLTRAGIDAAGLLGARVFSGVGVGAWLVATTPFPELEHALGWLRVPAPLLEIASLARRYIAVLESALHTARAAQTLRLGYKDTRTSLASAGVLSPRCSHGNTRLAAAALALFSIALVLGADVRR